MPLEPLQQGQPKKFAVVIIDVPALLQFLNTFLLSHV